MAWQHITFRVAAADVARIEALLAVAGACSVSISDASGTELLEPAPGQTPLWPETTLTALFAEGVDLERLRDVIARELPDAGAARIAGLVDEDWLDSARPAIEPVQIAGRLCLLPADHAGPGVGPRTLRLGMGLAFGTGRHPTTRLCLEWLAARPLNGRRVLDYGCGSGVLALAALVLGAESALAVDVEPQALQATRDNARLNGLETRIWLGAPHELAPIQADIVLANIIARSLEALAPELSTRVVPGGRLVLSGLLETQVDAVRDAYAPAFRDFAVATAAGWALLEATRARQ